MTMKVATEQSKLKPDLLPYGQHHILPQQYIKLEADNKM